MSIKIFDEKSQSWLVKSSAWAKNIYVLDANGYFSSQNVEDILKENYVGLEKTKQQITDLTNKFLSHIHNHPGGSGDGGTSTQAPTLSSSFDETTYEKGQMIELSIFFSSPNEGDGLAYFMANGETLTPIILKQGFNLVLVGPFNETNLNLSLYATDSKDTISNLLTWNLKGGGIQASIAFDDTKDFKINETIELPFTVDTDSGEDITLHLTIQHNKYEMACQPGPQSFTFPSLEVGIHPVSLYFTSDHYKTSIYSFNLIVVDTEQLWVSSMFHDTDIQYLYPTTIDYRLSKQTSEIFTVRFWINDELVKTLHHPIGTYQWMLPLLDIGLYQATIEVEDSNSQTDFVTFSLTVVPSEVTPPTPSTMGLTAWFDAKDGSNFLAEPHYWYDKVNQCQATLHHFNFVSNGWKDSRLVCNGKAYVEIPIRPLAHELTQGFTLECVYEAYEMGEAVGTILDLTDSLAPYMGLSIQNKKATFTSEYASLTAPLMEAKRTHIFFIVDRQSKQAKIYLNGCLAESFDLIDNGLGANQVLEQFSTQSMIYLNATKGEESFGACGIEALRIYNRSLTDQEVLTNYIASLPTVQDQFEQLGNHQSFSKMPTLSIYGELDGISETQSRSVRLRYQSPSYETFGRSFDLSSSEIGLENEAGDYTCFLKTDAQTDFPYTPFKDGLKETAFCLKHPSRSDYLVEPVLNQLFEAHSSVSLNPLQQTNRSYRTYNQSFPILVFKNDEYLGIYHFTYSKHSMNSFGYDQREQTLKVEVTQKANQSGAFCQWDASKEIEEAEYYRQGFHIVYPASHSSYDAIKSLVAWVDNSDDATFKQELSQHFNQARLIRFYVQCFAFGMVDQLQRFNLITFDGHQWDVTFSNVESSFGMASNGALSLATDIEEASFFTQHSNLWSKLERVFQVEIVQAYRELRLSFLNQEALSSRVGQVEAAIPTHYHNLDYLKHMKPELHGSRAIQLQGWMNERLAFMDSYYHISPSCLTVQTEEEGELSFSLHVLTPVYVSIDWDGELKRYKAIPGTRLTVSHRFVGQEPRTIQIYQDQWMTSLSNLTLLKPTQIDVSTATHLSNLECHFNGLTHLTIGQAPFMKQLDLRHCRALGNDSVQAILNLSHSLHLETLDIFDTQINALLLPTEGGALEHCTLPYSIQTLRVKNQPFLTNLGLPIAYRGDAETCQVPTSLHTVEIENCGQLSDLSKNELETTFDFPLLPLKACRHLTLINTLKNWTSFSTAYLEAIETLTLKHLQIDTLHLGDMVHWEVEDGTLSEVVIEQCPNILTVVFGKRVEQGGTAFKKGSTLDLSTLPQLKTIHSNVGIKGLETLIIPTSITSLVFEVRVTPYMQSVSDLKTIKTPLTTSLPFEGIDLSGVDWLTEFSMASLDQVENLQSFKLRPINVFPAFNSHRINHFLTPIGSIDLSQYIGDLAYLFKGVDLEKITIQCDHPLTQSNARYMFAYASCKSKRVIDNLFNYLINITDISYMFYHATILYAPTLPITITDCRYTFFNCSSMISTPENWMLPFMQQPLSDYCYTGCDAIQQIEEEEKGLDGIPLAWGGYERQNATFEGDDLTIENTLERDLVDFKLKGRTLLNLAPKTGHSSWITSQQSSQSFTEVLEDGVELVLDEPIEGTLKGETFVNLIENPSSQTLVANHPTQKTEAGLDESVVPQLGMGLLDVTIEGQTLQNLSDGIGKTPMIEIQHQTSSIHHGLSSDIILTDAPILPDLIKGKTLTNLLSETIQTDIIQESYQREIDLTAQIESPLDVVEGTPEHFMMGGNTLTNIVPLHGETPVLSTAWQDHVRPEESLDSEIKVKDGIAPHAILTGRTLVNAIQESSKDEIILPYEFEDSHQFTLTNTKETGCLNGELHGRTLVNVIQGSSQEDIVLPYGFEEGEMAYLSNTQETGELNFEIKGKTTRIHTVESHATLEEDVNTFEIEMVANTSFVLCDTFTGNSITLTTDWGDGTVDTELSHTYAVAGTYTVKTQRWPSIENGESRAFIHRVLSTSSSLTTGKKLFSDFLNLISIDLNRLDFTSLLSVEDMFANIPSSCVLEIDSNFALTEAQTSFAGTFTRI